MTDGWVNITPKTTVSGPVQDWRSKRRSLDWIVIVMDDVRIEHRRYTTEEEGRAVIEHARKVGATVNEAA